MAQQRKFSEEFKREAVDLTRLPCANVSQIAQDLGIDGNLLFRWRRELVIGRIGERHAARNPDC